MSLERPIPASSIPLSSTTPSFLTPYFSESAGALAPCFLVLPGGGYGMLAGHEGEGYTPFFNALGIHALVLNYRLGSAGHRHPAMLEDACLAMKLIRSNAEAWGIQSDHIGVIGSSAGGHLTATLVTQWNHFPDIQPEISARPDLGVLCYPVISMQGDYAHSGSRKNLLGENPSAELMANVSTETQVTKETPPCFLWHTLEDPVVQIEHSLLFAKGLREAGVPFELHIFEKGPHGIGMRPGHPWTDLLRFWLNERGWLA